MAFEYRVDSLDDLPESSREHYVERDGKFEITVNGMKTQGDVERVKTALVKERKDHEAAKAKVRAFGESTPEGIETILAENEDLKLQVEATSKEGGPTKEDIDARVENLAQAKIRPLEREVKKLSTSLSTATGENQSLIAKETRRTILEDVFADARLKEIAIDPEILGPMGDVELWAERVFERVDGKTVSKDGVGVTPGLSPKEIFVDMKAANLRRHWYGETVGAGAGGGKGGGSSIENPFKKGATFNVTKAAKLIQTDPAQAKRLAKAAGREDMLPTNLRDN